MGVEIRPAKAMDIERILLRSVDGKKPGAMVITRRYFESSLFAWTGLIDGKLACIWGLIAPTIFSEKAYLWLITTDLIDDHKFIFIRHSQMVISGMLDQFPVIAGHVLWEQSRSKKWLKWLGVRFGQPIEGSQNARIVPFELRRADIG